jgi:hypothetical protein
MGLPMPVMGMLYLYLIIIIIIIIIILASSIVSSYLVPSLYTPHSILTKYVCTVCVLVVFFLMLNLLIHTIIKTAITAYNLIIF